MYTHMAACHFTGWQAHATASSHAPPEGKEQDGRHGTFIHMCIYIYIYIYIRKT